MANSSHQIKIKSNKRRRDRFNCTSGDTKDNTKGEHKNKPTETYRRNLQEMDPFRRMAFVVLFVVMMILIMVTVSHAKVYERCQLARELKNVHKAPNNQLATWVCIAKHESSYNTNAVGRPNTDGSRDHGLFQINDRYWCSPPGTGKGCGKPCAKFEDDNIADDYQCVQTIFKETKRLRGDGFKAWSVYEPHCKGSKADAYIKGCF